LVISAIWDLKWASHALIVASFLIDDSKLCVVDDRSISMMPSPKLPTQTSGVVKLGLMSVPDCNDGKNNRSVCETDTTTGKTGLLLPTCCR
jgi:hypothetical protein